MSERASRPHVRGSVARNLMPTDEMNSTLQLLQSAYPLHAATLCSAVRLATKEFTDCEYPS